MIYPFTEQEMESAADTWGCNCGPSALAFALQTKLDVVRPAIPQFDERRYTSPSMMKAALANLGRAFIAISARKFVEGAVPDVEAMFHEQPALVRIQWCGPWTMPGANPKWAYRQTHWITTWRQVGVRLVFDCNGGARTVDSWIANIVPELISLYPRASGEWFPTHIWRLHAARKEAA